MGLCILGVKIKHREGGEYFTQTNSTFARSLPEDERIHFNEEDKEEIIDCLGVSYGTYNGIRGDIAKYTVGKTAGDVWGQCVSLEDDQPYPHPIYHLINFSDCEGYIGPKAVKEMATYLQTHEQEICDKFKKDYDDEDGSFYYNVFKRLSEGIRATAREDGYLCFC